MPVHPKVHLYHCIREMLRGCSLLHRADGTSGGWGLALIGRNTNRADVWSGGSFQGGADCAVDGVLSQSDNARLRPVLALFSPRPTVL